MPQTTCPNCGDGLYRTGYATPGNTPEKACKSCWWKNTPHVPALPPEHQGEGLSFSEAADL